MTQIFPLTLLQAISDWQRGSTIKRGERLKQECAALPVKYKTCSLACFRQIALPPSGVWDLLGEDRLPEKVSSWTIESAIAKAFKNGVPPEGQGYQGVVFSIVPTPASVIVNLNALYADPDFIETLKQNAGKITGFYDGAGKYSNTQSEVVLEIATVEQSDVHSLGGHSSSFEKLVGIAAFHTYGRCPTPEEKEKLLQDAAHLRSETGPCWLSTEASHRVINEKIKPSAEILREIKLQQEAAVKQKNSNAE